MLPICAAALRRENGDKRENDPIWDAVTDCSGGGCGSDYNSCRSPDNEWLPPAQPRLNSSTTLTLEAWPPAKPAVNRSSLLAGLLSPLRAGDTDVVTSESIQMLRFPPCPHDLGQHVGDTSSPPKEEAGGGSGLAEPHGGEKKKKEKMDQKQCLSKKSRG